MPVHSGISGFYAFTAVATDRKLKEIIRFCYIFTIVALAGSTVPFFSSDLLSRPWFSQGPLGILRGCAGTGEPSTGQTSVGETSKDISKEVSCKERNYQWVINVGGVVTPLSEAAPAPQKPPPEAFGWQRWYDFRKWTLCCPGLRSGNGSDDYCSQCSRSEKIW